MGWGKVDRLKAWQGLPFRRGQMDPVSGSCSTQATYGMLAAKKQLDITEEEGKQALQLLDSAKTAAPSAPSGSVGRLIDVKA